VITVENQSGATRMYQLENVAWTQSNGEDVYTPTRELIVVPPVFQLASGKKQIVRVGLNTSQGPTERAYRLFVQELPETAQRPSGEVPSVQTLIRMGIPVFVPPLARDSAVRLVWIPERSEAGITGFVVENPAATHVQISRVQMRNAGESKGIAAGFYLLAGEKRRWNLPAPADVQGSHWQIEAETDQGRLVYEPRPRFE
jgi:fimbrial chaperone protein